MSTRLLSFYNGIPSTQERCRGSARFNRGIFYFPQDDWKMGFFFLLQNCGIWLQAATRCLGMGLKMSIEGTWKTWCHHLFSLSLQPNIVPQEVTKALFRATASAKERRITFIFVTSFLKLRFLGQELMIKKS